MKSLRKLLVPLFGLLLLAVAVLLSEQNDKIAEWKSKAQAAEQKLSRQDSRQADLELQVQKAQAQLQSLETALTLARQAAVPAPGPATATVPGPAAATAVREREAGAGGAISPEQVQQWLADAGDPAVMRRLNTQARNQTLRRFDDLLQRFNLPPEQNEALIKLLTDKRQVALDTAIASFQQGNDPTKDMEAYRDLIIANRDSIEAQISSLLGPVNYAQYQENLRSTGQANVLSNLQLTLSNTKDPLTPEQAAQLQQVMQDNQTARITGRVISESKDFLTPVQVQAMQDLRALQQANAQKRVQPVQVLPTGGKPPAAGKN